jgi:apolipoprotein N-acyltransferase
MVWVVGLWGNVLPGLVLLLLGLGTMVLALSTLRFSHVFTACLGFAAFALLVRERAGPPSWSLVGLAGLLCGYAVSSEYPLLFVALVLGGYVLSRRESLTALGVVRRGGAYAAGGLVGIVPLALYNHFAFGSWTQLA